MGTCVCACGAKYRFAADVSGKTARCKRCGETLTFAETVTSSGHPHGGGAEKSEVVGPPPNIPECIIEVESAEDENQIVIQKRREQGYWSGLLWSLLFPSSIHNLAAFLTIWCAYGFIYCLPVPWTMRIPLIIFWIALQCWLVAFRVGVVEAAAMGQYRLPDVEISGDFWSDLIEPALRWCGSWLVVLLPALLYSTVQGYRGINVIGDTWKAIDNPPLPGMAGPVVDAGLVTLATVGVFFWPLVLLVVVFGSFGSLWRIDMILQSVGNTLFPYLVTPAVVALGYGAIGLSETYLTPTLGMVFKATTTAGLGTAISQRILSTGIGLYAGIVMARAIGLYFRHFGHRLAWDWGQK